jgi:microcystin degradation protein MlrC
VLRLQFLRHQTQGHAAQALGRVGRTGRRIEALGLTDGLPVIPPLPGYVDAMVAAGVGNEVTLTRGARTPMPALAVQSVPLTVTGRVKAIVDGRFEAVGEANRIAGSTRGLTMDMGRSAVLDTGKVEIVVISRYIEPVDPGVFTAVGIQPERKRYLMLKSRIHYRRGFRAMAKAIVAPATIDGLP